jgi:hypothetical protein
LKLEFRKFPAESHGFHVLELNFLAQLPGLDGLEFGFLA